MNRRSSVMSAAELELEAEAGKPETNWLHEIVAAVAKFQARWQDPDAVKSEEEKNMDRITEVIRTYRGIYEEDEEDDETDRPWVDHWQFDAVICAVIVLNMLSIGLQIDHDTPGDPGLGWVLLEVLFMLIFVAEVVLKVKYHGPRWMIDSALNILATAIAFLAVLNLILSAVDQSGVLRMFSLLRIVGLLRLLRIIRRFRALEELRLIIEGLRASGQAIFWVVVLIVVFIYTAAVVTTTAVGKNAAVYQRYKVMSNGWDHEELFGTLGRSMHTLVQVMTLDSWSSRIARHIINNQWYMSVFFLGFIILSTHGLLNIVISVIVDHVLATAQSNRTKQAAIETEQRKQEYEILEDIFQKSDLDNSGDLELHEFLEAVKDPEVRSLMRELDLQNSEVARLFGSLDGEGSQPLSLREFIEGLSMLKGPAQARDLLALQAQSEDLTKKIDKLADSLDETERLMDILDEVSVRIGRRFNYAVAGQREKLALAKVGLEPIVPPKMTMPGARENVDLSTGNRPALPQFPNLLS